jgi:hypothetical protein
MTYATTSATGGSASYARAFAPGRHRRTRLRGVAVGVVTITAASLIATSVLIAGAWVMSGALHARSVVRARTPMVVAVARVDPYAQLAALDEVDSLDKRESADDHPQAIAPAEQIEVAASLALAMSAPPPVASPPAASRQRPRGDEARTDSISLPPPESRTAVYDIAAHTVYLPDGKTLEAHSGLGGKRDDPRFVHVKNHGATPPNIYNLTLREAPFHGVRAIRLNPASGSTMFGRDGILAHTYMLGPNGQSNGCVSFRNYPAFLQAFLKGDVRRIVVVDRLASPSARAILARAAQGDRYALNQQ